MKLSNQNLLNEKYRLFFLITVLVCSKDFSRLDVSPGSVAFAIPCCIDRYHYSLDECFCRVLHLMIIVVCEPQGSQTRQQNMLMRKLHHCNWILLEKLKETEFFLRAKTAPWTLQSNATMNEGLLVAGLLVSLPDFMHDEYYNIIL